MNWKWGWIAVLSFVAVLALVVIFKPGMFPEKPNIILISIDTLRQDHVGTYGYHKDITPVLDSIASEGVKFRNSYAAAPWTLPSHMSMFTGLPPSVHKVDFDVKHLAQSLKTFPVMLKDNGYHTGGIISGVYLKSVYGFSRGFDVYKEMFNSGAEKLTDSGIDWIKGHSDRPFFLFLHYFDVHYPYRPPEKYAKRLGVDTAENKWLRYGRLSYMRKFSDPAIKMSPRIRHRVEQLYDSEILRVDTNIGRLIEFLKDNKLYDSTVITVTSDHGEEFCEHGSFGHYHQLYAEVINVPLIIRLPGKLPPGKIHVEPVSSVDIPVTLLSMAGITAPEQFRRHGIDLSGMAGKDSKNSNLNSRKLISETRKGSSPHFALIHDGYKFITPYRFQPLLKTKKWVETGTGLFQAGIEGNDLANLAAAQLSDERTPVLIRRYRKDIHQYVKNNIDCVRIVFIPPKKGTTVFEGSMTYKNIPELTPFGITLTDSDFIRDGADGSSTEFRVVLQEDIKELLIHLSESIAESEDFHIKIIHSGKVIFNSGIDISKLSKAEMIFKGLPGSIYIIRQGRPDGHSKPSLSDKEKSILKSLGYIN